MHRDADTTVVEYKQPVRKRRVFSAMPCCAAVFAIALLGAAAVVLGAAGRMKKPDVMKVAHSPVLPEVRVVEPDQAVAAKFRHVIFRAGNWEIFRFTYEEGEADGAREIGHE